MIPDVFHQNDWSLTHQWCSCQKIQINFIPKNNENSNVHQVGFSLHVLSNYTTLKILNSE